jgi:hypothetical protein
MLLCLRSSIGGSITFCSVLYNYTTSVKSQIVKSLSNTDCQITNIVSVSCVVSGRPRRDRDQLSANEIIFCLSTVQR